MARQAVLAYNPLERWCSIAISPVPLYFQLAQHFENEIRSGNLVSGDRLENEVKIAEDLGLSRPTVRAAFSYLVDKGLVLRRRGQGTVVTKGKVSRSVKLTSLFDDLAEAGKSPTTKVLHNEVIKASDLVKRCIRTGRRSVRHLPGTSAVRRWRTDRPDAQFHSDVVRDDEQRDARAARVLRAVARGRRLPRSRHAADLGEELLDE